MTTRTFTLVAVILAFTALTVRALMDFGYIGLIAFHLTNWGSGQLLADLTIACLFLCVWMYHDAPQRGLSAWPFILITLAAGSFGPLLYLLVRELRTRPTPSKAI